MKFRCIDCNKEWILPKEKLVYIGDWPDTCPNCGSTHVGHETVKTRTMSSVVSENVNNKELDVTKHKRLRRCFEASRNEEVKE
jgi:ssDNA-binding Zn-finger/Zn-ribbon topoisomerase 1